MTKYPTPPYAFLLLLIFSSCFHLHLHSQTKYADTTEIPFLCEIGCTQVPEFPGGRDSLFAYLYRNIHLPKTADSTLSGAVIVEFTIDAIGNVTNAYILKSLHPQLDSIVIAAFTEIPRWKPAINYCGNNSKGHKEAMTLRQPIRFSQKKD
jgi:TonB family protein